MVHARQGGGERSTLVKDSYHLPSMRNCSEVYCRNKRTFCTEVDLHQGSAVSPFSFAIMMDSLMENIRKDARDLGSWEMMFADDVVLCAREKDAPG